MNLRTKIPIPFIAAALSAVLCSSAGHAAGTDEAKKNQPAKGATLSEPQIIAVAEAANAGEVAQGKLAENKAKKQPTKSFADLIVAEHEEANQKVESLAEELHASPKPSRLADQIKKDGDAVQRKLNQTAAAVFDRVYLQSQIDEHREVLKMIDDRLIPSAKSPKLKSLLSDLRTHVAHHMQVAKTALEDLDKSG